MFTGMTRYRLTPSLFKSQSISRRALNSAGTRSYTDRSHLAAVDEVAYSLIHHRHHHLSLNREGHWSTTDDFATSGPHFSLFSTALWDLVNSGPVHSLMLSSHLFFCLPCLLPYFTVSCKMVLARPDEWKTCPYLLSLHHITMVRRPSCGPIACCILERTSSLVTWSLYEMRSILR